MGSGPDNVTSTTRTEVPRELKPAVRTAGNALLSDFYRMSGNYYGTPFALSGEGNRLNFGGLFGGKFQDAYDEAEGYGLYDFSGGNPFGATYTPGSSGITGNNVGPLNDFGDPVAGETPPPLGTNLIGQGQDLLTQTLGGGFLSPESNPYLEQTFNRAADLTQNRLSSEFAGAGRNLGAALPARSEELQTLASNIFGRAYDTERGYQNQALVSAQNYDPVNLLINRLAGLIPNAGGTTVATQPVFKTGLFG